MENKKSLEYLNSKWWYRLSKIFFNSFFVILMLISNIFVFYTYKENHITKIEKEKVSEFIKKMREESVPDKQIYSILSEKNVISNTDEIKKEFSFFNLIIYFLFNFIIVCIIFEVVRRLFYFIFLGLFFPK